MGKQTNYQDLLKLGAIVTMVVDHLGGYFFPEMMGRIKLANATDLNFFA